MSEDATLGATPPADSGRNAQDNPAGTHAAPDGAAAQAAAPDFSFLPDGLQSLGKGFDKPESFWAHVSQVHGMYKEREALTGLAPESLVTDEDWQKAWAALGKPENPEGYKLPEKWQGEATPEITEAVNAELEPLRPVLAEVFHAANITGKQAEALVNLLGAGIAADKANAPDAEKVLAELWPQETSKHLDAARRGARYAGLGDDLDRAGLSANPLVLRMAHKLGELVGEGGAPGMGAGGGGLPTGQRAQEELYRVVGSDEYKNNDPVAIRKAEALASRIDLK